MTAGILPKLPRFHRSRAGTAAPPQRTRLETEKKCVNCMEKKGQLNNNSNQSSPDKFE